MTDWLYNNWIPLLSLITIFIIGLLVALCKGEVICYEVDEHAEGLGE